MRTFESAEEFRDRIPRNVMSEAEALFFRLLIEPVPLPDPKLVDGWTLTPYALEYRCTKEQACDLMNRIVQRAAYDWLEEQVEEAAFDDSHPYGETFQLGDPRGDGAVVLIGTPKQWWTVPSLEAMANEGLLEDYTYGNDSCPSLGKELMDGQVIHIFVGHMHPDHHTRQDGCDPRFHVNVFHPDDGPGESAWSGESEVEVAEVARRLIAEHGGVRRQLRKV